MVKLWLYTLEHHFARTLVIALKAMPVDKVSVWQSNAFKRIPSFCLQAVLMTEAYLVRQTRNWYSLPRFLRTRVIALKDMPKDQTVTVDRKSYGFIVPRLARTLVIALKAVPIDGA